MNVILDAEMAAVTSDTSEGHLECCGLGGIVAAESFVAVDFVDYYRGRVAIHAWGEGAAGAWLDADQCDLLALALQQVARRIRAAESFR